MSDLNKALGKEGSGRLLLVNDKEYKFSPITLKIMGEYEEWLEATLKETTYKALSVMPDPELLVEVMEKVVEKINQGYFKFYEGKGWGQEVRTQRGILKLAQLLLRQHQPDLTKQDVYLLVQENQDKFAELLPEILNEGKSIASRRN